MVTRPSAPNPGKLGFRARSVHVDTRSAMPDRLQPRGPGTGGAVGSFASVPFLRQAMLVRSKATRGAR